MKDQVEWIIAIGIIAVLMLTLIIIGALAGDEYSKNACLKTTGNEVCRDK